MVSDNLRYRDLMKEHKRLTPIVEKYLEYKKAKADAEEARALLEEGGLDKDFKEMVLEQLDESGKKLEQTSEELRILLLPQDPNDDKNVIIEIRGGAGGDEAALFANTLYRMYSMYAEQKGWKSEICLLYTSQHCKHDLGDHVVFADHGFFYFVDNVLGLVDIIAIHLPIPPHSNLLGGL